MRIGVRRRMLHIWSQKLVSKRFSWWWFTFLSLVFLSICTFSKPSSSKHQVILIQVPSSFKQSHLSILDLSLFSTSLSYLENTLYFHSFYQNKTASFLFLQLKFFLKRGLIFLWITSLYYSFFIRKFLPRCRVLITFLGSNDSNMASF